MLDWIYILLLISAIYKGYKNGAIVTLFSFLSIFIGIILAIKFSTNIQHYISQHWQSNSSWLPKISFFIVFIGSIILVNIAARLLKKTIKMLLLGWFDSLFGIIVTICYFTLVFSIFVYFFNLNSWIPNNWVQSSTCGKYLIPIGKWSLLWVSNTFSWFKNLI